MPLPSLSTHFKVVKLGPSETLSLTGDNECNGVLFVFDLPVSFVTFSETSSVTPALNGAVPLNRLVFNRTQSEAELPAVSTVTFDEISSSFSSTEPTCVGYYGSAIHDAIVCSPPCVALLYGRKDAKGYGNAQPVP